MFRYQLLQVFDGVRLAKINLQLLQLVVVEIDWRWQRKNVSFCRLFGPTIAGKTSSLSWKISSSSNVKRCDCIKRTKLPMFRAGCSSKIFTTNDFNLNGNVLSSMSSLKSCKRMSSREMSSPID